MDQGPLALPDAAASADLQTFAARARRLDAEAALRLVAHGPALAAYACALYAPRTPTVLALRVLALAEPSEKDLDVTVPAAALVDRLARADRETAAERPSPGTLGRPLLVPLPPMAATGAGWAGLLPPRGGWSVEGVLRSDDLRAAARAGIEEVAAGTPPDSGAAAVAALRSRIWGRPLPGHRELPAGAAFGAEVFGFLGGPPGAEEDVVSLHRAGLWWRLSTVRGHILTRQPPSF